MAHMDGAVIVVDDDEDDIGLTTLLLRKAGVFHVPALRRAEGVLAYLEGSRALLRDRRPLALILDVNMPGMSGLQVLEQVRARAEFDSIPIVMWSASEDPRDLRTAARLKAQCYVSKYPTVSALKEILSAAGQYDLAASPPRYFHVKPNLLLGRDALPDLAVA